MIEPFDAGACRGYEWRGDGPTAVVLPGAMMAGTPSCYYAALTLFQLGRRVVQVWDEWDGATDRTDWALRLADAALAYAADADLLVAKSITTRVTGVAADRGLRAVWLTPLLVLDECVEGLRRRTAPALLVGGTNDEMWDGALARELSPDVLEIDGADHGLARIDDLAKLVDALRAFA